MAAQWVHLKRANLAQHLQVGAYVGTTHGKNLSDPMNFIVDTASERTLIQPFWQEQIERLCAPLSRDPDQRLEADTMLGPMTFDTESGFVLRFECIDKSLKKVVPLDGKLCFLVKEDPRTGRGPLEESLDKCDSDVPFNILGRDVLNQATLIVPPRSQHAFMIFDHDIMPSLRRVPPVSKFLKEFTGNIPTTELEEKFLTDDQAFGTESASTRRNQTGRG